MPFGVYFVTHTHSIEFVPAGVSCLCPYDNMLLIGPDNLTHTHTALGQRFVEGMDVPVLE